MRPGPRVLLRPLHSFALVSPLRPASVSCFTASLAPCRSARSCCDRPSSGKSTPTYITQPFSTSTAAQMPFTLKSKADLPDTMSPSDDAFVRAIASNRAWSRKTQDANPSLLPTLAKSQSPKLLWIGCSDSRLPETTILGLQPGDVFVHRNIANVVHSGDLNLQAVLSFAVDYLKVEHVILCGHTGCGGAKGAMGNQSLGGVLDTWLMPLRAIRKRLERQLKDMSAEEQADLLVKHNVISGTETLKENAAIIKAMKERGLQVHGCVLDIKEGLVNELEIAEDKEEMAQRLWAFDTNHNSSS